MSSSWSRRLDEKDNEQYMHGVETLDQQLEGGVNVTYEDLYAAMVFFAMIYVGGQLVKRFLRMPSLVGEIFAGILLGPNLADYVPYPSSFVMLGQIGLILLVIEAGIDIDLATMKLIGSRGLIIALVGSVLPIAIAFVIAISLDPSNITSAIAAGSCFGPTSFGIAMSILRQGKIVNTPVGQLIVSAAVIDDMIALVILSQLRALTGNADVASIIIPIISALGFLIIGGYIAIFQLPRFLDRFFFPNIKKENHGVAGLALMFLLLFGMMPATYYAKSSFLMGAFISGLVFCRNHDVHVRFVSQYKRLLQWLMRIFFAASIGFQVPIKEFGDARVIGVGLLFTLALVGKLAVGFLVPNFNNSETFRGLHLRDCLITGCSMAAEGEFAFVIAVFSVDSGLIYPDLYASIVLAVLLSTIISPFALRFTISYFNKMAERMVRHAEHLERQRANTIEEALSPDEQERRLREHIEANKIIFLCIQIQCASTWGLVPKIISTLTSLDMEVIDNRSWHPWGVDSTLMNEIFVEDDFFLSAGDADGEKTIDERIAEVSESMKAAIRQPGAKVKVTRWFPGVLQTLVDEVNSKSCVSGTPTSRGPPSIKEMLAKEAAKTLEAKRNIRIAATMDKSLDQIKKEIGMHFESPSAPTKPLTTVDLGAELGGMPHSLSTYRSVRQKMRSTPVTGGSLFDDIKPSRPEDPEVDDIEKSNHSFMDSFFGHPAELVVNGELFKIRVMPQTVQRIRSGYSGELLDDDSVMFSPLLFGHCLEGFVRTYRLDKQTMNQDSSEKSSDCSGEAAEDSERENKIRNALSSENIHLI